MKLREFRDYTLVIRRSPQSVVFKPLHVLRKPRPHSNEQCLIRCLRVTSLEEAPQCEQRIEANHDENRQNGDVKGEQDLMAPAQPWVA
jgi:hypothetical protein